VPLQQPKDQVTQALEELRQEQEELLQKEIV